MKQFKNRTLEHLLFETYALRRAEREASEEPEVLLDRYLALRAKCRAGGHPHSYVSWRIAVVLAGLGDLQASFEALLEAQMMDPSRAHAWADDSATLLEGMRDAIALRSQSDIDYALQLYQTLSRHGLADDALRLEAARLLERQGNPDAALRLLEALKVTSPHFQAPAALHARLARTLERQAPQPAVRPTFFTHTLLQEGGRKAEA